MKNKKQQERSLCGLVEQVLSLAKREGATETEVTASAENGFGVTVRQGALETVEYHRDNAVTFSVYFGKQIGGVTVTDVSHRALKDAVKKACHIAKYTQPDPYLGLADPSLMAKEIPDLDRYYPWDITPEQAIQQALDGEKIALTIDKRIVQSEGFSISTLKHHAAYGNSHGLVAAASSTIHSMSCSLIAKMNGKMERDSDYTIGREDRDLMTISALSHSAVDYATRRLNARKIKTQKMPVIFDAPLATTLLSNLISAISGHHIYRKSSFLIDAVGERIFPDFVNIDERPYIKKGLGSAAFDAEGVATRNQHFIKDGVLQKFVLGSYAARKLNLETTANAGGVHNLRIEPHDLSLQALFKKMGTGLYIIELIGSGVNIITGDYSRGAVGLWVENGEIQYPVSEITIAGNLKEMFKNIVAIGNDIDIRGNIQSGSMLIDEMMIAGSR